jgi:hypothetical protein
MKIVFSGGRFEGEAQHLRCQDLNDFIKVRLDYASHNAVSASEQPGKARRETIHPPRDYFGIADYYRPPHQDPQRSAVALVTKGFD